MSPRIPPRFLAAGPAAVSALHRIFGIPATLKADGTYVLERIEWKEGMLRVSVAGRQFGRAVLELRPQGSPDGLLTIEAQTSGKPSHPHVERLIQTMRRRLHATAVEDLLDLLRRDPDTEVQEAFDTAGLLGNLRAGANLVPKPYAHTWQGKPGEVDQWGLFFDDLVFVFTSLSRVNFVAPTTHVVHGCHECICVTPKIRTRSAWIFHHPRRPYRPAADRLRARLGMGPQHLDQPFKRLSTDMNQVDTIVGAEEKLANAMRAAVATGQGERIVAVNKTCLPQVMGEDMDAAVAMARNTPDVHCLSQALPLTHDTSMYTDELEFGEEEAQVLRDMLLPPRGRNLPEEPGGKRVDLVGFPDGSDTSELVSLLEACGATVNALLLPDVDVPLCVRTPRPNLQVRYPNSNYEQLYEGVFRWMADQIVTPPAPFGLDATERWMLSIARALELDVDRVSEAIRGFREEIRPRWEALSSLAGGMRVGFVVDERVLPRLTQEARSFGLSLRAMVQEMGFGMDVLCYAPEGDVSYARKALPSEDIRLHPFRSEQEMHTLLRDGAFRAVYSDRASDHRLTRSGKSQFSFADFEMGFHGALRSLERLVRACSLPFYRRYATLLHRDCR